MIQNVSDHWGVGPLGCRTIDTTPLEGARIQVDGLFKISDPNESFLEIKNLDIYKGRTDAWWDKMIALRKRISV